MENESYFKTVTSIQSNRSEYQLSKPIKSHDRPVKESDLALMINKWMKQYKIYNNQINFQQQAKFLYILLLKLKNNSFLCQQLQTILIIYLAAREKCANKQNEKLSTPLFQVTTLITNAAPLHKPTVKTTQFSNQPTSVFDFTDNRKEQNFKPHCIKITEPGNNSDLVYKQQLKTSNLPNRENLYRNPITNGDPKSEYTVFIIIFYYNRSTKTPFPKNQINFVG